MGSPIYYLFNLSHNITNCSNLNIMMWNAQTIKGNVVKFKQFLHDNKLHLISLSETGLALEDRFLILDKVF